MLGLCLIALALFILPFLCLAGDAPGSGATSAASASVAPSGASSLWWIPVIVPMLVAGLKAIWPSIPKVLLPVLCPILGIAANYLASFAGVGLDPASAAALGALGVFLREIVDQGRKSIVPNPNLAPALALLVIFGALNVQAASPGSTESRPTKTLEMSTIVLDDQIFHEGEVQFDTFGTARIEDLTNLSEAKKGAGMGLNYFPWRSAGFGIEARGEGWQGVFIDSTAVSLIGRYPLEALRLAPEIKLGADYDWRPRDWSVFAAVGLDYRLTKNVGIAGELRGVRPIAGAQGEHLLALLKLRLAF